MAASPTLPDDAKRLLPLTPAVFYVLLALSTGPKHGYAIMQETNTLSEDSFQMGPATLYSTIQRLVALQLIDEISEDAAGTAGDTRRRYYELTKTGRLLLETDVSRMSAVARMASARLVHKRSQA